MSERFRRDGDDSRYWGNWFCVFLVNAVRRVRLGVYGSEDNDVMGCKFDNVILHLDSLRGEYFPYLVRGVLLDTKRMD